MQAKKTVNGMAYWKKIVILLGMDNNLDLSISASTCLSSNSGIFGWKGNGHGTWLDF